MANQIYPIGVQSFSKLRSENCYYVDKTALVHELVTTGYYYFLSRPRRFGKSLLISTLHEYFKGNRGLFKGLAIDRLEPGEWPCHPVLHIDFNGQLYDSKTSVGEVLESCLREWEREYGASDASMSYALRFGAVIRNAVEKTGRQVVVLIDEYDKPILDVLGDRELEENNREVLRSFYSVMKSQDANLRFVMLTGVGKLPQMNVFSGLNNIMDISMNPKYSTICGITEPELHEYFGKGVADLAEANCMTVDEAYEALKANYDGYHFAGDMRDVYNPFSLLIALYDRQITDSWYRTGTPTHLIKMLKRTDVPIKNLDGSPCTFTRLTEGNVTGDDIIATLYYTGYLTIKQYNRAMNSVILGYPNGEVRRGFLDNVLALSTNVNAGESSTLVLELAMTVQSGDIAGYLEKLRSFFADFPYELIKRNEAHYQDVIYCITKLLGFYVQAEYRTSSGRADMILGTKEAVYVFEFKLDAGAEAAMSQIDSKEYALPFAADGRRVVKVAVSFSSETRNIADWTIV